MTYATLTQLKAVIPARDLELLTDFEGEGLPSDARLEQALDDASAEISGYVGKLLAGAEAPHILTVICRDLAMHRLYLNLGHDMAAYDALRRDAIAWLKAVQRGETSLGDDEGAPVSSTPGVAMTDGAERQMTRDGLRGF